MAWRRVLSALCLLTLSGLLVLSGYRQVRADTTAPANAPLLPPASEAPPASTASPASEAPPAALKIASSLTTATHILDVARQAAATDCANSPDVLVSILCEHRLRVGLRTFYPGFSVRDEHGAFTGFEPDIGRRIAAFLGVAFVPVAVDAKSRIPMVADGEVDLVIATMGHTLQRGSEVRFIRPHYYASETAVVGAKARSVADWDDLAGRTACLPVGSNSNLEFIRHHVRILTFDRPEQLLDALRFDQCSFIVQDDTFFAQSLADPAWSARYGIKFRFAPLPWGMAVTREDAAQFAALLDNLSVAFHIDGTFLDLAKAHQLDLTFLEAEHTKWTGPGCITADGALMEDCLGPPVDVAEPIDPSPVAPYAAWLEQRMSRWFDISIDMSLFENVTTFGLLLEGISYTLALIVGTQISTAVFALGFGWLMTAGPWPIRRGVGALTAVGQVTPLPLLMFFVYVNVGAALHFSGTIALLAAIVAIGLYNGSNAARAIVEAHRTLLQRRTGSHGRLRDADGGDAGKGDVGEAGVQEAAVQEGGRGTFFRAISLASVQLVAFLINAAKGSPAAGMIGVPDFLNVVTDLTASSPERVSVYLVLLVFYVSLVLVVIVLLSTLRARLVPHAGRW
jgi:ABC-type amino acid transport substrate-binding protein/ABC-type amino acid transport system permease subunit